MENEPKPNPTLVFLFLWRHPSRDCTFRLECFWAVDLLSRDELRPAYDNFANNIMDLDLARVNVSRVAQTIFFRRLVSVEISSSSCDELRKVWCTYTEGWFHRFLDEVNHMVNVSTCSVGRCWYHVRTLSYVWCGAQVESNTKMVS